MSLPVIRRPSAPRGLFLAASLAALAACSPNAAVKRLDAPAVKVTPIKGSGAPEARRLVVVPVEARANGKSVPARCELTSTYYRAEFDVPANLQLPDYGARTPSLDLVCEGEAGKGTHRSIPENVENNNATAVGGALFGVVGAVIAAGATQNSDSEHFYRAINVRLK